MRLPINSTCLRSKRPEVRILSGVPLPPLSVQSLTSNSPVLPVPSTGGVGTIDQQSFVQRLCSTNDTPTQAEAKGKAAGTSPRRPALRNHGEATADGGDPSGTGQTETVPEPVSVSAITSVGPAATFDAPLQRWQGEQRRDRYDDGCISCEEDPEPDDPSDVDNYKCKAFKKAMRPPTAATRGAMISCCRCGMEF